MFLRFNVCPIGSHCTRSNAGQMGGRPLSLLLLPLGDSEVFLPLRQDWVQGVSTNRSLQSSLRLTVIKGCPYTLYKVCRYTLYKGCPYTLYKVFRYTLYKGCCREGGEGDSPAPVRGPGVGGCWAVGGGARWLSARSTAAARPSSRWYWTQHAHTPPTGQTRHVPPHHAWLIYKRLIETGHDFSVPVFVFLCAEIRNVVRLVFHEGCVFTNQKGCVFHFQKGCVLFRIHTDCVCSLVRKHLCTEFRKVWSVFTKDVCSVFSVHRRGINQQILYKPCVIGFTYTVLRCDVCLCIFQL